MLIRNSSGTDRARVFPGGSFEDIVHHIKGGSPDTTQRTRFRPALSGPTRSSSRLPPGGGAPDEFGKLKTQEFPQVARAGSTC